MQTQLGDSRSGKLNENLLGFGRALRRVGRIFAGFSSSSSCCCVVVVVV